ncbi:MAG: hybrid sensor histidine kinase/response regulator [Magnetococcus sp. YQC-5]
MHTDNAKILIVDDETTNIDILVQLLQDEYKVVVAKNGAQALKRANAAPQPDLILLDIMMPGMDGFEVCQLLQEDKATANIPVIFITGQVSFQDETRALALGAVDFIRKPFNPSVTSARIHTHLAVQQTKNRLLELNTLKNKFLGIAAHDLRNPLNSIMGLSEMMLSIEMDEHEKSQYTKTIHDIAQQMLVLINDLLDVSVIESGRFAMELQPGNLAALVNERVQLMQFVAKQKNVTINAVLYPTPETLFDPERLAQVIDNLISNAIKFTQPNTEITVHTGHQNGHIFFQVIDTGPGIPDAEQHQLFEAFQKLSVRPTAREKSTGLGLSIVKKIIDAHEGRIVATNNSVRGATFTCLLPSPGNPSKHFRKELP